MKDKYDNEIRELNSQLNNYKSRLNHLNFEYQNLLENFHKLKQEIIFQNSKIKSSFLNKEERKESLENEYINYNRLSNNNNNIINNKNINQQNNINEEKNINKNENNNSNHSQILKKNKYSKLKRSKTFNEKNKINKSNSNIKNKLKNKINNTIKPKKKIIRKNISNIDKNLLIDLNNPLKRRFITNEEQKNSIQYIEEEIFSLERKVAELNVSYQSFLQKLKELPNNNFKESNDLKNTLKYLQDTIEDKNKKLKELKVKQQQFLIQSAMDIN